MKRLLSRCLLGIAVSACSAACVKGGGGGGTSPDPVPSGPPNGWTGTARHTSAAEYVDPYGTSTWTFDLVNITWVKDPNPFPLGPPPPPGTVRYKVVSGTLRASWRSRIEFGRTNYCWVEWDGDFSAPTRTPSPEDRGSFLELRPDGQYEGNLYGGYGLQYRQECRDGMVFVNSITTWLDLDIKGTLDGGRMRGEMAPKVLTTEALTSKRTGSWDFAAN
jgi:hypothetical protein